MNRALMEATIALAALAALYVSLILEQRSAVANHTLTVFHDLLYHFVR